MKGLSLLHFLKRSPYFIEVFRGKPTKWITRIIHFKILGIKPFLAILWRIRFLRNYFLEIDWECRERVLEYPWLYRCLNILPDKARILDIGCAESPLVFELASMGYDVVGLDLRDYPLIHPNLRFVIGNIFWLPFLSESFDFVSAISTIEHLGIPTWGIPSYSKSDIDGINEIHRCLRPGGLLFFTVPFGVKSITWQRIYDYVTLQKLLAQYDIITSRYYKRVEKKYWIETQKEELEQIPSTLEEGVNGVAIYLCRKLDNSTESIR
jgi:SAM-dependent methyltransferase